MKNSLSCQERIQRDFWDKKSEKETFAELDWVGIKEQNDFFKFADISGQLNVLEIGAGTGKWTIPLLQKGFKVTATDISEKSLQIVLEKARKLKLDKKLTILHDNFEKPNIKEKFDSAFCFGVIHHFDPEKRETILESIVLSLKKGGSVFILEPNPLNPLYYFIYFWRWLANSQGLNRWKTEKGFLKSSLWGLKKSLKKAGILTTENEWYGYLPSRFALFAPFVLKFNNFMNRVPFFGLFSAYVWMRGEKNE